ncbi:hypothetical protein ACP3W1_25310, partial [Salmonella enterica]|uniref:hypothetical protein n=1 Tax=Salmonella enterica TaxID=28901 RepID=UPI003CED5F9A
ASPAGFPVCSSSRFSSVCMCLLRGGRRAQRSVSFPTGSSQRSGAVAPGETRWGKVLNHRPLRDSELPCAG